MANKRTRAQVGRLSRRKGATAERYVANTLKPIYPDAHRQPQSQIKQLKAIAQGNPVIAKQLCLTDVVAGPYGIECKHRKVLPRIEDTLQQAIEDVGQSGKIPVAWHRKSGAPASSTTMAIQFPSRIVYLLWDAFRDQCVQLASDYAKELSILPND